MDKVKNLFKRKSVAPAAKEAEAAAPGNPDAKPITLQLSKASPKVQATGVDSKVAVSATQLAGLRVKK